MRKLFFLFLGLLFFPLITTAGTADLSLSQNSVEFSKEILIVGDTVRIYATVKNVGEVDVSGYVAFYQGSLPIGDSQTISSRAGSTTEEVYVDFVVPAGSFNIRAEIRGTDPVDENEENNLVLTQLFTPILDDDRDGLENDEDNCPSNENSDQIDTDLDGLGNACDEDDDGDGLTDGLEAEISTSPLLSDTDGDGLFDATDPHPTIQESQIASSEEILIEETITPFVSSEEVFKETAISEPSEVLEDSTDSEAMAETEDLSEITVFTVSPKAVFAYQQIDWQTFRFLAKLPSSEGYRVSWDFGDGVVSNKIEVDHRFAKSGDYSVKVVIEDPNGQMAEDSAVIHVPFFSLSSPLIRFVLACLSVALIIALYFFWRSGSSGLKPPKLTRSGVKISVRHDHSL